MKFPYNVKIDGVFYPSNTEIINTFVEAPVISERKEPIEIKNAEDKKPVMPDYESMTLKELKEIAAELGLKVYGIKKETVIELLKGAWDDRH